jgi:hypothetical protein
MIKKITTLVSTNKKAITRKVLIYGGVALGIVAGALLVKPDEDIVISEVVEGEFTISERTHEEN